MKIPLTEKLFLVTDPLGGWNLREWMGHYKDGSEHWRTIGYYNSPGQAIRRLAQHKLHHEVEMVKNLSEALQKVEEVADWLTEILDPIRAEALEGVAIALEEKQVATLPPKKAKKTTPSRKRRKKA